MVSEVHEEGFRSQISDLRRHQLAMKKVSGFRYQMSEGFSLPDVRSIGRLLISDI
jgi:hypothetical protein